MPNEEKNQKQKNKDYTLNKYFEQKTLEASA